MNDSQPHLTPFLVIIQGANTGLAFLFSTQGGQAQKKPRGNLPVGRQGKLALRNGAGRTQNADVESG